MKFLKILLLILILFVLVAVGWVYQAGLGVERTIFNPDYYEAILRKTGLTAAVHEAALEAVVTEMAREIPGPIKAPLMDLLAHCFTPAWMDEQISVNIRTLIDHLDGRRSNLVIAVDLTGPKATLVKELDTLMAGLSASELSNLGLGPDTGGKPGEALLAQLDLPDKMPLTGLDDQKTIQSLEKVIQYRRYFGFGPYIFFGLTAVLCLLLAGISGGLRWFGSGLIVSGATFSLFLLSVRTFAAYPAGIILSFIPPEAAYLGEAARIAADFIRLTADRFLLVTAVYTAAGLLLVLTGLLLRVLMRGKKKKAAA